MEQQKVIELEFPIGRTGEEKYTSITVTGLQVKHLRMLPSSLFDGSLTSHNPTVFVPVISAMSKIAEDLIEEMSVKDLLRVVEAIMGFLALSPVIGKT